jgi:hypothetical protein
MRYWNLDVTSKMLIITTNRTFMAIVLLFVVAATAHAHHSVPVHYDLSTEDSVNGVITRVVWRNPHSFMELDVTNDNGEIERWHIEMGTKNTTCVFADGTRFELAPTGQDLAGQ